MGLGEISFFHVYLQTEGCHLRGVSLGVAAESPCPVGGLPSCPRCPGSSSALSTLSEGVDAAESVHISAVEGLPSGTCIVALAKQ